MKREVEEGQGKGERNGVGKKEGKGNVTHTSLANLRAMHFCLFSGRRAAMLVSSSILRSKLLYSTGFVSTLFAPILQRSLYG